MNISSIIMILEKVKSSNPVYPSRKKEKRMTTVIAHYLFSFVIFTLLLFLIIVLLVYEIINAI